MSTRDRSLPWILFISSAIVVFLVWLIYLKPPATSEAGWVQFLPAANACFNTLCACCLVAGWRRIRRGDKQAHARFMVAAVVFSALFFASYVTYHHYQGDTPFQGQGAVRPFYFGILISHIVLSIVVLPFILTTLYRAATGRFQAHKRVARLTLPMWLYVSVTGVVVFAFLQIYG